MKKTVKPCGIVAAAGNEELLKSMLQILRDLQPSSDSAGPALRVSQARTITEIKQKMAPTGTAAPPELLLFGMSEKDAACLDDLLMISGKNPQLQMMLLVRKDLQPRIAYRCRNYQIHVFSLPLRSQVLSEMISMMLSMRARILEKEEELSRMRKKLKEIGVVTKAKCVLIQTRGMTEEEAHHYLEKHAMDEGLTKMEVATSIIRIYGT